MRHQVTNGDVALVIALEPGNEIRDAIAQPHAPVFDQLHHAGRGRHHLRQRRDVEDRVGGHRLGRGIHGAVADRFFIEHAVAAADQDHGTGELLVGDRLFHQGRNRIESCRVDAVLRRRCRGHRADHERRGSGAAKRKCSHAWIILFAMPRSFAAAAIAAAALALGALAWVAAGRTGTGAPGPVILISIDTLRADHLPIYGYTKVRTPNIDALAGQSVVFDRAYSHAPQTLPAHASILSGVLPFEHGVRDNIGFTVKPTQWSLQRALHDRGWPTGGFVSAYVLRAATGISQGFDTYDSEVPATSGELSIGELQRGGEQTLAVAGAWLTKRENGRPFFLFLHLYEPHKPYTPPARFASYEPYDGEIAYADEIVGRFLDRLRTLGLFDRVTIVLVSDHGEGLGGHGEQVHGLFLYQETTRVPLLIKPGCWRGGSKRTPAPVQHIDVAPTLLELAGEQKPAVLKGRSLVPLMKGTGTLADTGIYAEALYSRYHFGWSELYSLTDTRYRLIRAPRDELFDLERDPKESTSLAGERPQVRQAMRSALETLIKNAPIDAPAAVSEQDKQRLAALGYVGGGNNAALSLPGDSLPDPKDKISILERYRRAADLAGELKFNDAVLLYREVLAEDPAMTDVWLQLAEVEVRRGAMPEAIAAYGEVIKRKPKDPESLIGA